jgi:hypothetical protein
MDNQEEVDVDVDVQEPDTLSAALSAAWDDAEEELDDGSIDARSEGSTEGDGHTESSDTEADGTAVPEQGEPLHKPDNAGDSTEVAPKSLPPAAREAWGKTPKAMRDAIATREKQYEAGIMKYANGAKQAQQMQQTIQPFQQYTSMNGGPGQAIHGLLQTGSLLQMGTPSQKAEAAAGIIKQFGIDINMLDNMLVGAAPPPGQQQQDAVQQAVNQAVAPYQQTMHNFQQQQQAQMQRNGQEIHNDINAFARDPANDFYNDVRGRMADELDMAAKNSVDLSLKQAYDLACRANPEVWKVISTREAAKTVGNKRRAASSIHGNPNGESSTTPAGSLRGAIEQAWENSGRM